MNRDIELADVVLGTAMLSLCAILAYALFRPEPKPETYVDPATGVHYLIHGRGITPRLAPDGTPYRTEGGAK